MSDLVSSLQDDLALMEGLTREAGAIAARYFKKGARSWTKSGNAPVTEADIAVDSFLEKELRSARPAYGWLSEETAPETSRLDASRVFIVDPIDGTRGFMNGSDEWTISVAMVEQGRPAVGVLFNPMRDEMYLAAAGHGSRLNGDLIAPSQVRRLEDARLAASKKAVKVLEGSTYGGSARYIASLAYRFALVARGDYDGTLSASQCHEWDIAAAAVILSEAGGIISGHDHSELVFNKPTPKLQPLVGAGLPLHKVLCERLSNR